MRLRHSCVWSPNRWLFTVPDIWWRDTHLWHIKRSFLNRFSLHSLRSLVQSFWSPWWYNYWVVTELSSVKWEIKHLGVFCYRKIINHPEVDSFHILACFITLKLQKLGFVFTFIVTFNVVEQLWNRFTAALTTYISVLMISYVWKFCSGFTSVFFLQRGADTGDSFQRCLN